MKFCEQKFPISQIFVMPPCSIYHHTKCSDQTVALYQSLNVYGMHLTFYMIIRWTPNSQWWRVNEDQPDANCLVLLYYTSPALHVSDAICIHPQERHIMHMQPVHKSAL